jgi:hypothetical protein
MGKVFGAAPIRWRLLDANTLEYQATVEHPKLLTGPWTTTKSLLKRAPGLHLQAAGSTTTGPVCSTPLEPPTAR